jgi:membrane protein
MIYRTIPDAEIEWRDVWLGALVTALFVSVGKWAIGLYLGRTAVASAFGAAGSVVLILLWVHYASLLLLLGAEFTHAYTIEFRQTRRKPSTGARRTRAPREGETGSASAR